VVSVGRILRDYRDAGSVNGLLALWGFVDDTTFLTKAGHVGVVYRIRGVDYEGLSHPQRQALAHRFEAALRLRRTLSCLSVPPETHGRTICRRGMPAGDRERGDPASSGLLERSPRRPVRPLALLRPALRSPARGAEQHGVAPPVAGAPPGLASVALARPYPAAPGVRAGPGDRGAPPQGAGIRGADR
jgi:hypothetical protein